MMEHSGEDFKAQYHSLCICCGLLRNDLRGYVARAFSEIKANPESLLAPGLASHLTNVKPLRLRSERVCICGHTVIVDRREEVLSA